MTVFVKSKKKKVTDNVDIINIKNIHLQKMKYSTFHKA